MGWGQVVPLCTCFAPSLQNLSSETSPTDTPIPPTQASASALCQPLATAHASALHPPVPSWTHRKA